MKSSILKRSIIIDGHVSLEDAFWSDPKEIAYNNSDGFEIGHANRRSTPAR